MRCRCCKLDGKDAVDVENGLITEEEMRSNVPNVGGVAGCRSGQRSKHLSGAAAESADSIAGRGWQIKNGNCCCPISFLH